MVKFKNLALLGFPKYRVGDDGSVWSCLWSKRCPTHEWRKLSEKGGCTGGKNPYRKVTLSNGNGIVREFLAHRLVLLAFVGPCPPGMEGCHENGIRMDNRLTNLRWDTPVGNQKDRIKHGTSIKGKSQNKGNKNGMSKLTQDQVDNIRDLYEKNKTKWPYERLAAFFGVSHWTIGDVVRGDKWK